MFRRVCEYDSVNTLKFPSLMMHGVVISKASIYSPEVSLRGTAPSDRKLVFGGHVSDDLVMMMDSKGANVIAMSTAHPLMPYVFFFVANTFLQAVDEKDRDHFRSCSSRIE